jgi:hypothetical protein
MTALALVLGDDTAGSADAGGFSAWAGVTAPLVDSLMGTILAGPGSLCRFVQPLASGVLAF